MEKKPNRLASEKSLYLLQHAYNPVDWFPWGEDAFERARAEGKLIFLSIGYSTCYWCHVMERECFEDEEVAALLNHSFISIKVDREESPHIDKMYMDFAAALMSSGTGWPLNIFLTPELKPFFACTYLPAEPKEGLMGFKDLIRHVETAWQSDLRDQLIEQADQVIALLENIAEPQGSNQPSEGQLQNITASIFEGVDPIFGGLQGEPKFPLFSLLLYLLNYSQVKQETRAGFFVSLTLEKMAGGGIFDQIGGGFCRYAVDPKWQIPHFEKMLYDNALMAELYLSGWRVFGNETFREVAERTLDYVLKEMRDEKGGFFSAQDAESEGVEGKYYTFTLEEFQEALNAKELSFATAYYGVSEGGNFEGRSVLSTEESLESFVDRHEMDLEGAKVILASVRRKLLLFREKRQAPLKDDKIITSWTSLMIQSMAIGASSLGREDFKEAAIKGADFILTHLYKEDVLYRRYRDKEVRGRGILDDYVFFVRALITLFESGFGFVYLQKAAEITEIVERKFASKNSGYYYSEESDTIFFRKSDFYDGSEPSGNAVQIENLLRMFQITREGKYLARVERVLFAISDKLEFFTPSNTHTLKGILHYLDPRALSIVVALGKQEEGKKEILDTLAKRYLPHASLVWIRKDDPVWWDLAGREAIEGKTTLYLCYKTRCVEPVVGTEAIVQTLKTI